MVLLALADTRATYEQSLSQDTWTAALDICRELLDAWYEKKDEVISPIQLITGDDLLTNFKLKQGPEIGRILGALKEDQAAGLISSRSEAEAFVRGWLMKNRDTISTSKTTGKS